MGTFAEDERFIELFRKLLEEKPESKEYEKIHDEFVELWWDIDRIEIREFQSKDYARWVQEIFKLTTNLKYPESFAGDRDNWPPGVLFDEEIDEIARTNKRLEEYYKLTPPFVKQGTKIPIKLKKVFSESRHCFIDQHYNATIVLSRAIVENVIKQKLGSEEYEISKFLKACADKALEWKMINSSTHDLAIEINIKANNILHGKDEVATDKDAKDIINKTKDFLEEAYGG